jgi:hypothetical protein
MVLVMVTVFLIVTLPFDEERTFLDVNFFIMVLLIYWGLLSSIFVIDF